MFIYVLMIINVFVIVLVLCKNCFKYIVDLGVLVKINCILVIILFIIMFLYVGIFLLVGFCSKFYLFFVVLGCGVYLLVFVGIVISVISCWVVGRLFKVSVGDFFWYEVICVLDVWFIEML